MPQPIPHEPFLTMTGIGKSYPGVRALDEVRLSVRRGEVIGLVGENGAGKSTLMKILGGVVAPSEGTVVLDGKPVSGLTVARSLAGGIAFVHQELNLFDNLTVGANIFIGREPRRGGPLRFVDDKRLHALARPLLDQLGADFSAETPLARLSLAQMQLVEIAKALSLKARLVIMDEPTSSLTASETERLLATIARLKADGVSVILVTHRLTEIERAADRVVVLRDGRLVAELERDEIRADIMIRHMIGRDLKTLYRAPSVTVAAGSLSGGNQQKVVLAKWLSMAPRVLVFDEPTRGIDVGAKSEIYRLMRALSDRGVAILMISSDMEEVIGVSDRVAVMHEGRIAGVLERGQLSEQAIMSLAVGRLAA